MGDPEQHVWLVLTEAVPGREREFNDWYDNEHLADVRSLKGFTKAERFQLSPKQMEGTGSDAPGPYLALYWIDGDPDEAFASLGEAVANGTIHMSEAMDEPKTQCWNYSARRDHDLQPSR